MNFKKTAVALAAGMMLSGGAMAQVTIDLGAATDVTFDPTRVSASIVNVGTDIAPEYGLEFSSRFTSFSDIAAALPSAANVSALAASLNEVTLDGSIVIDGATVSFGAIDAVTASATATASNVENATATARAINGNSLATTVIGAMGTVDFENRISDKFTTDFAAQSIDGNGAVANLTGGAVNSTITESMKQVNIDADADLENVLDKTVTELSGGVSDLGDLGMVSASVNTGELLGNIKIVASNETPTWFLSEQAVASVSLTNLDAATTVIGAMNTTNAVNEVMRDVSLKTAVQVIGATTP